MRKAVVIFGMVLYVGFVNANPKNGEQVANQPNVQQQTHKTDSVSVKPVIKEQVPEQKSSSSVSSLFFSFFLN